MTKLLNWVQLGSARLQPFSKGPVNKDNWAFSLHRLILLAKDEASFLKQQSIPHLLGILDHSNNLIQQNDGYHPLKMHLDIYSYTDNFWRFLGPPLKVHLQIHSETLGYEAKLKISTFPPRYFLLF